MKEEANIRSTINSSEIDKFSSLAQEWWDEKGKFKTLHQINPVRLTYIKHMISSMRIEPENLLDVGCGGGLVSIPLAKQGFKVTSLDLSSESLSVLENLAKLHNLQNIQTLLSPVEEVKEQFDVVLALEVIEHTKEPDYFLECLSNIVKPGGLLIISSINRTLLSYFKAIIAAEYILKWLPKGTHHWNMFSSPREISERLAEYQFIEVDATGMSYSYIENNWYLDNNLDVNYIMTLKKKKA